MDSHPLKQTPFLAAAVLGRECAFLASCLFQRQFHPRRITILVLVSTVFEKYVCKSLDLLGIDFIEIGVTTDPGWLPKLNSGCDGCRLGIAKRALPVLVYQ